jgi:cyclophilin family peptidyl-prolyl cis-trans isomerase
LAGLWTQVAQALGLSLEEVDQEEQLARLSRPAAQAGPEGAATYLVRFSPGLSRPDVAVVTLTLSDPLALDGSGKLTDAGAAFFAALEQVMTSQKIDWTPSDLDLVAPAVRSRRSLLYAGGLLVILGIIVALSFAGVFSPHPVVVPGQPEQAATSEAAATPAATAAPKETKVETPIDPSQAKGTVLKIKTIKGDILVELFDKAEPITAGNFLLLAEAGFFHNLTFHRVVPDFVIQGGDPKGNGSGGPGFTIPDEVSPTIKHDRGILSMAKTSQPNSAGSQFFICTGKAGPTGSVSHLDGSYAAFGRVLQGMDVVDKIMVGDRIDDIELVKESPDAKHAKAAAKAARVPDPKQA